MARFKLLQELYYQELKNATNINFGTARNKKAKRVQRGKALFIPSVKDKILQVITKTNTDNDKYTTIVVFHGVSYVNRETPGSKRIISPSNIQYFVTKNDTKDIQVSCSCMDFYYRFATWDDNQNALYGSPPPPYIKTTNRPFVNPFKSPGVCKHIIGVMNNLKKRNYF